MTAPSDTPLPEKLRAISRWMEKHLDAMEIEIAVLNSAADELERRPRPPGEPPEDSAPRDEPTVPLLRQLLRIQRIASRDHGHTIGSRDWSNLCDDLDVIYDIAYSTIRDFPLERASDTRGEAADKLRAALWLMRRAIQRDDPVTLTPSEARALLALHGEKP